MKEYVEREAAKKEFALNFGSVSHAVIANRLLDSIPAADVAPVVRCKDCKHRGDHEVCPLHDIRLCFDGEGHMDEVEDDKTEDDFFCSYGERRGDGDEA